MVTRIIDASNLTLICWSVSLSKNKVNLNMSSLIEDEEFKNAVISKLFEDFWWLIFKKFKQIYSGCHNVVFCFEGENSIKWRQSIYPDYKQNRHHEEDNIWNLVELLFNQLKEACDYIPCKCLSTANCEADDCIYEAAVIEHDLNPDSEIEIWSTDRDLVQIMNYVPNVKVFHIIEKKFRNPEPNIIESKAICGDGSDNIKGVNKIGPKTFAKMMESEEEWNKKMTPENLKIYEDMLKIIDLRQCPFLKDIEKDYFSNPSRNFDADGLKSFFKTRNLKCPNLFEIDF